MKRVVWLQTHTVFWLGEGTISVRVSDVWRTEIRTAAPLVPEMPIEKLKRHKSPGIDQIPAKLIKAGGRTIHSDIMYLLILFGISRNCLRSGRSRSLYLFIERVIKQTVVIIEAYPFCQLHTKFYPTSCDQGWLLVQRKLLGIINEDFDATGLLLVTYCAFIKYLRKIWNTMKQCITYL